MNLYYEGERARVSRDEVAVQARQRAQLRMAQRCLDQAEEQRDVAFLVDTGLSLKAVADNTMVSRHRIGCHLATWSRRTADRRYALRDRAQETIAATVVHGGVDEYAVRGLVDRLMSILQGDASPDADADEQRAACDEVRQQVQRAHEVGMLGHSEVALLQDEVARREGGC